jgi:RNA polymerase sigma-70 factor (ECF subfamily)
MDDLELVEGLRARDEGTVATFLERYRPLLHHCIAQFETDATAREDLLQDLLGHVFERLDRNTFDPVKGSFGTWLYRVVWCRSVDLKRKQNARRALRTSTPEEELEEQVDDGPEPAEMLGDRELAGLVRAVVDELPDAEKALIRMRFLEGLTLAEIGRQQGISLEQTKYRLRRALADLRGSLLQRLPRGETVE